MSLRDFLNKNQVKPNGAVPQATKPPDPAPVKPALTEAVKPQAQAAPSLRGAINRFSKPKGGEANKPGGSDQQRNNTTDITGSNTTKPPVAVTLKDAPKPPAAIVSPREVPREELIVSDLAKSTVDDLRSSLVYLAEHIEHKDLVGQVVRRIAQMLIMNPQFATQMPMERKDFNLLVRGLRRSYNVAARKVTERKETRTAKSAEKELVISELEGLMNSF